MSKSLIAVLPSTESPQARLDQTIQIIKAVYDLSRPQGLGFLHFSPEPLTDEQALACIPKPELPGLHLDYIAGRACKFVLFSGPEGRYFDAEWWYDHSPDDLGNLIGRLGAEVIEVRT